VQGLVARAMV